MRSTSNSLDLFFLMNERFVDQLHISVGQLLDLVGLLTMFILRDLVILLGLLECLHAVAPYITHGNAAMLGIFVGEFGEFGATLAGQFWNGDAYHLAVRRWIESQSGLTDGLGCRHHQALVPDAHGKQARLWRAHSSDLVQ